MIPRLAYPALCALAGALLVFILRGEPKLPAQVSLGTIVLTKDQIEAGKPKPEAPKGLAKIATKVAPIESKAIANDAAADAVLEFTAAVAESLSAPAPSTDSLAAVETADSAAAPAAVKCFSDAHESDGKRLTMWLVCSDLAARRLTYRAPGNHSARVVGDSVIVTFPRFADGWQKAKDVALVGALLYGMIRSF